MKMTITGVVAAGLVTCVMIGGAMGIPIASESFDYPEGDLTGNNGGSGWSDAWFGGTPPAGVAVVSEGLSYTDSTNTKLSVAGNCVKPAGIVKRRINLDAVSRPELVSFVEDDKLGADGTTIWLSFLAHMDNNLAWDFIDLRADEPTKLIMGRDSSAPNWGLGDFPVLKMQGKTPTSDDVFFVVRIDFKSGEDNVYVWTNPRLDVEPAVRDAEIMTTRDVAFNSIWIHGSGYDEFDELRIGTFWEDLLKVVASEQPRDKDSKDAEKTVKAVEKKPEAVPAEAKEERPAAEEKKPLMPLY